MKLWDSYTEIQFFTEALKSFALPEQLFYKLKDDYFAYVPKGVNSEGQTLQSRNTLIGKFTERWSKTILAPIANKLGLYAVNDVVCSEIGLSQQSSGDLAFCTNNKIIQKPEEIKLLFEIKMSIVANYRLTLPNKVDCVGDYKQHKGNPALLRSDSMLKAIGKAINIRVLGINSTRIPIVILGNSPITHNYIKKVDFLKSSGVIQGFWSLNPNPTSTEFVKNTPNLGFQTMSNSKALFENCNKLIQDEMNYFSSMVSKIKLGKIISLANQENGNREKAERFLKLIQS